MAAPDPDGTRIRWIEGDDTRRLSDVHATCFDEAWSAEALGTLLRMPGVFGLLIEDETTFSGFILCRVAADEAEVLTLAVLPSARRRSLGRWLLQEAIEVARGLGAAQLLLEVGEGNAAARALYTEAGLQILGRRRNYYRRAGQVAEDALLLGVQL